jgi:beta-glucosidase
LENLGLSVNYLPTDNVSDIDEKALEPLVQNADCIVMTLGEPRSYSGENNNRQFLDLPFGQDKLVDCLSRFKKPLIGVVLAGRPLTITNLDEKADAILWCWHLGVEAGNSIARTLMGDVNPNAKTVVTFPKTLGQVPVYYNQYRTGRAELEHYVDGDMEPLYPFGYGLNYGDIRYHGFSMKYDRTNHKLEIKAALSNENTVPTDEIVQVYLSARHYSTLRPRLELCGFQKVHFEGKIAREEKLLVNLNLFFPPEDFVSMLDLDISVGPSSKNLITHELKIGEDQ